MYGVQLQSGYECFNVHLKALELNYLNSGCHRLFIYKLVNVNASNRWGVKGKRCNSTYFYFLLF